MPSGRAHGNGAGRDAGVPADGRTAKDVPFLRRFRTDIVLTACTGLRSASRENVGNARRKVFRPSVDLDDYILMLHAWKYYRAMESSRCGASFEAATSSIRSIPDEMRMLLWKIAENWFGEEAVTYAMPEAVKGFRQGAIPFASYLDALAVRKDPSRHERTEA